MTAQSRAIQDLGIDVDRREITRGLDPIDAVLAGVPFRHGSHLAIEHVPRA